MFKRKGIVLTFYTDRKDLVEEAPVCDVKRTIPSWFKSLPKKSVIDPDTLTNKLNMSQCAGFKSLYNKGFIIPMWSDLNLQFGGVGDTTYRYQFSDNESSLVSHAQEQYTGFLSEEDYQHIKLDSPWIAECNSDIDFMVSDPHWGRSEISDYTALSGIIDFKYQNGTNVNLIFPRGACSQIKTIPANQPLLHIIPLTERKVELKVVLLSKAEMDIKKADTGRKRCFFANFYKRRESINKQARS